MHATRDTPDVIFGWVVGGRVMRGVGLLRVIINGVSSEDD
jgi:hypothetical protein